MGARRESQRRAAVAVLALVAVAGSLGIGVSLLGGRESPATVVASAEVSQQALEQARKNLDRVFGPGIDLVGNDRKTAEQLLADTLVQLDRAQADGISPATTDPTIASGGGLVLGNFTLKAMAVRTGCANSDVASAAYTITGNGASPPPSGASGAGNYYS